MEQLWISKARYGQHHLEDNDFVDRLNSRYTIIGLIAGISIITANLFIGQPINCWTPAQFTDMHDDYAHSFCWLKGTYYLPTNEISIPDRSKPRIYYVSYYQWTPFILLGMSIFFLLPQLFWQIFLKRSGVNLRRFVHQLKDSSNLHQDVESVRESLQNYFYLRNKNDFRLNLTSIYFLVKFLRLVNSFGQFVVLNSFLSFQFSSHGFAALKNFLSSSDWFESPRFPRVTMCDFMIRNLGSNHHWFALQCNLPINIYNEKIFFIIWFWLIILTVFNLISIAFWLVSLSPRTRLTTIRRYFNETKRNFDPQKTLKFLKIDGFLIVQLIEKNTNEQIVEEILTSLNRHAVEFDADPSSNA